MRARSASLIGVSLTVLAVACGGSDSSDLFGSEGGGGTSSTGGTSSAGTSSTGGTASAGTSSSGGTSSTGGTSSAGTSSGGTASAGKGGTGTSGSGGTGTAGTGGSGTAGKGGSGTSGSGGTGTAGTGGTGASGKGGSGTSGSGGTGTSGSGGTGASGKGGSGTSGSGGTGTSGAGGTGAGGATTCSPEAQTGCTDPASKCTVTQSGNALGPQCVTPMGGSLSGDGEKCSRATDGQGNSIPGQDNCQAGLWCTLLGTSNTPASNARDCRAFCTETSGCQSGEACVAIDQRSPPDGVCLPTCEPFKTCGSGGTCADFELGTGGQVIQLCRSVGMTFGMCNSDYDCGKDSACLPAQFGSSCQALCDQAHPCQLPAQKCKPSTGLPTGIGYCGF
jgi:hypothetical protein